MAKSRRNVKRTFITNDSARKASFKKRKHSLMKKVSELSTLCGIEACAIVSSPYDPQPEVWPSPSGVQQVVNKFRRIPESERNKRMVNQESFLRQRIRKAKEQVKRQKKSNREKEMTLLMYQQFSEGNVLNNMSMVDLRDLAWQIDQKLKEIVRRKSQLVAESQAQVPTSLTTEDDEAARNGDMAQVMDQQGDQVLDKNMDAMQMQPWFINLINGGMDEILPFGDVNLQNGLQRNGPNPFFP